MAVAALTRTLDGLRDVFGRGMNLYSDVRITILLSPNEYMQSS